MQDQLVQLLAEIRGALRFRWYGMAAAWFLCLVGWLWVAQKPDVYSASARFYVDTSSALGTVIPDEARANEVENQLTYIRERMLSRAMLEAVVTEVGLDENIESDDMRDRLLFRLRESIEIESVAVDRRGADSIFRIYYEHPARQKAFDVVDTLLTRYIDETLGADQRSGATRLRFLNDSVADLEASIEAKAQVISDFKQRNSDMLPGVEEGYQNQIQTERDALTEARRELSTLNAQRAQQVADRAQFVAEASGVISAESDPPPNSLDARIRDARIQLQNLLVDFTERHPDVIDLRARLEGLEAERLERLTALGLTGDDIAQMTLESNPIYRDLQNAISETDIAIAAVQTEIDDRQEAIANLRSLIDQVPQVESQLASLTREYDVDYESYLVLVRQREAQQLQERASEVDQVSFEISDPPRASSIPVGPNRLAYLTVVFFGALGAGGFLSYMLAQVRPVFGSVRLLRQTIRLPVLGAVSHAYPAQLRSSHRRATVAFALSISGLFVLFLFVAVLENYGGGLHSYMS